eukprot:5626752-Pyramimonas_sp.AAC.1
MADEVDVASGGAAVASAASGTVEPEPPPGRGVWGVSLGAGLLLLPALRASERELSASQKRWASSCGCLYICLEVLYICVSSHLELLVVFVEAGSGWLSFEASWLGDEPPTLAAPSLLRS